MGGDSKPFFWQEGEHTADADAPYSAPLFHVVLALAACYFAMLFTNWSLAGTPNHFELDVGEVSAWMKMATQWFCYAAYAWTLAAPALFPDRNFGH